MTARRRFLLTLLLLIGVFLAAWGVVRLAGQRVAAPVPPPVPAAGVLPRAPDMEIRMYQGQQAVGGGAVRLSRLLSRGKPVVVNFFAGLCVPCRAEMPDFQRLSEQPGSERFLLISVDLGPYTGLGTREDGKALLRTLGITYPAGTVFDEDIIDGYQIVGMPTTVFITTDGRMLRKYAGQLTLQQMTAFTTELLRVSGAR